MDRGYFEVAPGVWGMNIIFVNIYMISAPEGWLLVDAGLAGSATRIIKMAKDLFGDEPPLAILMTHGHFDHRGALEALLQKWDVPVYAHQLEMPYLQGRSAYPPPDPTVGGGLMSLLSVLYPKRPINLGKRVRELPEDGSIPFLPSWLYINTPGHSPGHVSFFRGSDRTLVAGDAFVTTKQESMLSTLLCIKKVCGPPRYFTPDWIASKASVRKLRDLEPKVAATGHGKPMRGVALARGLNRLVDRFDELAVPGNGRYTDEPAKANRRGVQYVPPPKIKGATAILSGLVLSGLVAFAVARKIQNSTH